MLLLLALAAGAISLGNDVGAESPPDGGASPTSSPAPTPGLDAVLVDSRRILDLATVRDALELYRERSGAYPSTAGDFSTLCVRAFDAGCLLLSVNPSLPASDGSRPYWYRSDGTTYMLLAVTETEPEPPSGGCPTDIPAALTSGPVYCVGSGSGE